MPATSSRVVLWEWSQAAQNAQGVAGAGVNASPTANGFFEGDDDFTAVEAFNTATYGGLYFPSVSGVQGLDQQALVGGARHDARGVEYPLIRYTAKGNGGVRGALDLNQQHF
ncbi:MAG: hypothetical protein JJD98_12970 [Polaromonas sp.]|nr:hypothetical protein [Polaromonas sp.]